MILAVWRCWLLLWEPVVGGFHDIPSEHPIWDGFVKGFFAVIPVKRWWWMERSASFRITRFSMSCQYVLPRKLTNKTLIQWCLEDDSSRFDKWSFGYPNSFIFPGCTHIGVIETPADEADRKPSDIILFNEKETSGKVTQWDWQDFVMFRWHWGFCDVQVSGPIFDWGIGVPKVQKSSVCYMSARQNLRPLGTVTPGHWYLILSWNSQER